MDHLPLPPGRPLTSRRARGNPIPEPVVRRFQHGPELVAQLDEVIAALPAEVVEDEQDDARVVLKFHATTRLPNGPFSRLRLTPLGEGEDWTYFVLSTRESRELLTAVLAEYGDLPDDAVADIDWAHPKTWAKFVDAIRGIELYGPDDRRDASLATLRFDQTEALDCLLWPSPNESTAVARVNELTALVNDLGATDARVRVTATDPRPDRTLVRVVATAHVLEALLHHFDIERVRAPLTATITTSSLTSTVFPANVPHAAKTAIGVVDGVVNVANPLTGPTLIAAEGFPTGHVFSGGDAHGTAVASVATWGDLDGLVVTGELPTPHPVVSAQVLDLMPSANYGVTGLAHVTIEEAIRWLASEHGVRIINLSINQPFASASPLRDELTITVDTLARELGVVIVVSTGNVIRQTTSHWLADYPTYLKDLDARVAAPGDAALAVTVGSHAARDVPGNSHSTSRVPIAKAGQPSPFTRVGPAQGIGSAGTMKPEFSHHGGNWVWDQVLDNVDSRDPGCAAVVAIPPQMGRIVGADSGTSYAAPAVAHEIARIAERYPDAGANLLRALTALSARPSSVNTPGINPAHVAGYGRPDATNVLESGTHRVFLTYEGDAPTNRVLVHRLPIPAEFADGVRRRTIRVALAFDPPVRRSRREYIAGTMMVELVRGLSLDQVEEVYSRQPSRAAAMDDPSVVRHDLPDSEHRPPLAPGVTTVESNTLIRRDFVNGAWDVDHGDYFLVVTHNQSAWTTAQRNAYSDQKYALAVEIADETETELNLYAAIRAQLRGRLRAR